MLFFSYKYVQYLQNYRLQFLKQVYLRDLGFVAKARANRT